MNPIHKSKVYGYVKIETILLHDFSCALNRSSFIEIAQI